MNVLALHILLGSLAALLLAIPIGAGLARLLMLTPPWRRTDRDAPVIVAPAGIAAVARLDGASERAIARLISTAESAGTLILRTAASGRQLGVLMSIDRFELLRGTELIVDDPEHMRSLLTLEADVLEQTSVTLEAAFPE